MFRQLFTTRMKYTYISFAFALVITLSLLKHSSQRSVKIYRPVVIIHGMLADAKGISPMEEIIKQVRILFWGVQLTLGGLVVGWYECLGFEMCWLCGV